MNKEQLQGNWQKIKGNFKEKWAELTEDDLLNAEGNFDELVGKIVERYGMAKEEAENKLKEFLEKYDDLGNEIKSLADDMNEYLDDINEKCSETMAYAKKTIRKNPLGAAGVCFAVGAFLGMLISR